MMKRPKSNEEIHYDLSNRSEAIQGTEHYPTLLNVLRKIELIDPAVYEFTTDKISYQSNNVSFILGLREYLKAGMEYVIVLCDNEEDTIAHEIAHAVLNHKTFMAEGDKEFYLGQEDGADDLAKKWGFIKEVKE